MQKTQYSIFKIATCITLFLNNQNFELKQNKKLCIVEKMPRIKKFWKHLLHLCTKFQRPRSNNIFLNLNTPPNKYIEN